MRRHHDHGRDLTHNRRLSRGAAPHPGPPSEMGCERVISSPDQAQPYPGTSGTAGAHFDRPCGQTLAVPKNPCSPKGADRGDDDLTPCHWRAINRGEKRLSVARGHFAPQVRRPRSLNATERGCDVGRIDGRCRADTSAPPSGCGCGLILAVRPGRSMRMPGAWRSTYRFASGTGQIR